MIPGKKKNNPVFKNCKVFIYKNEQSKQDLYSYLDKFFQKQFRKIGAESSNAYAMIMKGYSNKKYIVKIPRKNNGKVDSLYLEYIAGMDIRKNLCRKIPNFEKVYGYISKCNPTVSIKQNITNKNDLPQEFLIIERISPGYTLREIFEPLRGTHSKSIKDPKFQSIILQVMNSLEMAQELLHFVHYDLHLNNILIKKNKNIQKIDYYYNKKKHTVPVFNGDIACIIDYGRTHTKETKKLLNKNKQELFKMSYKFLLEHDVDVRTFNKKYDAIRFCCILKKMKIFKDFDLDVESIKRPKDVIDYLLMR